MFVLLIAADLFGRKHNVEIGFPSVPSLDELSGHAEATFRCEARRLHRQGRTTNVPIFVLDRVKIFDDRLNRWTDLTTESQLLEWSQLYLLQHEGSSCSDSVQMILDPPVRIRTPLALGVGKEKFFFLFHDADFNGNGYLNREEVQRLFNVLGLYKYSEVSVDEFFTKFDTNRDGVLSLAEFTKWMHAQPDLSEEFLKKSLEYWVSCKRRPDVRDSSQLSDAERAAITAFLSRGNGAAQPGSPRAVHTRRL